jgi:hypothetical protein
LNSGKGFHFPKEESGSSATGHGPRLSEGALVNQAKPKLTTRIERSEGTVVHLIYKRVLRTDIIIKDIMSYAACGLRNVPAHVGLTNYQLHQLRLDVSYHVITCCVGSCVCMCMHIYAMPSDFVTTARDWQFLSRQISNFLTVRFTMHPRRWKLGLATLSASPSIRYPEI